MDEDQDQNCPICFKTFNIKEIEVHVNRCLFLSAPIPIETNKNNQQQQQQQSGDNNKRSYIGGESSTSSPSPTSKTKKLRLESPNVFNQKSTASSSSSSSTAAKSNNKFSFKKSNKNDVIDLSIADDDDNRGHADNAGDANNAVSSVSSSKTNANKTATTIPTKKPINNIIEKTLPLSEKMRPNEFTEFMGQEHIMGKNTILRNVIDKNEVPSMILWGPPGCGKTTLAHIIANQCKRMENARFVKLSATMVGINEVKEVIKIAKNEQSFKRKTILFMDEIHRFNKLQQDTFLPHVESGVITLIGATTENPSFSLNSALLSRCRVIILDKLSTENMIEILLRATYTYKAHIVNPDFQPDKNMKFDDISFIPEMFIENDSIVWLAEMCDGDARIALNSLQLAVESISDTNDGSNNIKKKILKLDDIKEGIKKSHLLYDRKGDQHYDMISALHKSIRASDENAALYWCTRMMLGGEDPRYICRRMVRAASEDIGLGDPQAVAIALSALNAVQLVGMPEADCIIAQCAIYLARARKDSSAYVALTRCKMDINECKGALPSVPLHLRNAPTKLMKELGYAKGYNLLHKNQSGLTYMPEGMEHQNYFN